MPSKRREEKYADLLRRLSSPHDGEVVAAVHLLIRALSADGRDLHFIAKLVETDEARMQRIFDAGREKGKAEEIELRQRSVVALSNTASPFDDGIGDGINGYTWEEVVGHCVLHKRRLSRWERGFVESVAAQLARSFDGKPTSEKMALKLREIFQQRFNGAIA